MAKRFALQKEIRTAIANGTIKEGATNFYFADNSTEKDKPDWEGDDEFEYKGEMYDVITKTKDANGIKVVCIRDAQEERLLDKYKDWIKTNTGSSKKNTALVKLITAAFIIPEQKQQVVVSIQQKNIFNPFTEHLFKGYTEMPLQPPQQAS